MARFYIRGNINSYFHCAIEANDVVEALETAVKDAKNGNVRLSKINVKIQDVEQVYPG